jgi:hypothetical protein
VIENEAREEFIGEQRGCDFGFGFKFHRLNPKNEGARPRPGWGAAIAASASGRALVRSGAPPARPF